MEDGRQGDDVDHRNQGSTVFPYSEEYGNGA
jgi:hypothetical protein